MALNITINRQLRIFEATDGQAVRARLVWEEAERRGLRVSWSVEVVHFDRVTNAPGPKIEGQTYPMDDRFAEVGQMKAAERAIPWADALALRLAASGEEPRDELIVVAFGSGSAEHLVRAEE